jgi:hypothetical protein
VQATVKRLRALLSEEAYGEFRQFSHRYQLSTVIGDRGDFAGDRKGGRV